MESSGQVWQYVQGVESQAGEIRVQRVRLLAVLLFFANHLIQSVISAWQQPVDFRFQAIVTILAALWLASIVISIAAVKLGRWSLRMPYVTTFSDVALITVLLCVGDGPNSWLVLLFFLVIAAAPLRLDLRLVYFSTGCAMLGYLVTLAEFAWFQIGWQYYYGDEYLGQIDRAQEFIVLIALLIAGVFAGQVVRQIHRLGNGLIDLHSLQASGADSSTDGGQS